MKKVSTAKISGIPITLFFPLYARAVETGRKDAIFKDFHAVRIKDAVDFDFSIFEKMKGKLSFSRSDMLAGISIRTKLIDDFVTSFLKENPDGLIINLGCGLDSRFQRLDNDKITWVDMDLPEVIEMRKQFFEESGRYRMAGASILDESWVEASKAYSGRTASVMILAEGTLMYFKEPEVKTFFNQAAANFPDAELCFEVMGSARQDKVHPTVQCLGVNITCPWGIDDYPELEKWNPKLQLVASKSFIDYYAHRWGLFPRALSRLFPRDKNRFGHSIVHMKIKSDLI